MAQNKGSNQAKQIVERLIDSKNSEKTGYIAAIEPTTGEVCYSKSTGEATKEGSRLKKNKAIFFFMRVGYPSVHIFKGVLKELHEFLY